MTLPYEYIYKYCHLNLLKFHPIIETKIGVYSILTFRKRDIVMNDRNLHVKALSKWHELQRYIIFVIPSFVYKELHVMLGWQLVMSKDK